MTFSANNFCTKESPDSLVEKATVFSLETTSRVMLIWAVPACFHKHLFHQMLCRKHHIKICESAFRIDNYIFSVFKKIAVKKEKYSDNKNLINFESYLKQERSHSSKEEEVDRKTQILKNKHVESRNVKRSPRTPKLPNDENEDPRANSSKVEEQYVVELVVKKRVMANGKVQYLLK